MKFMPYIIILSGLLLIFLGVRMLVKNNNIQSTKIVNVDKQIEPSVSKPAISVEKDQYAQNKQKGDDFEAYVVNNFDKRYFTLKEWRSDKYVDGNYPVSNHFPDLEIEFNLKAKKVSDIFAIECKYRSNFFNDSIKWAEEYQFKNYQDYAINLKIPVFVIIGVGGMPSKPFEIFIVPLSNIHSSSISRSELGKFKKNNFKPHFYWKFEEKMLE